jgi:hypothetical protein
MVLIVIAVLSASGCGLVDYEEAQDKTQKRMYQADLENKYLGGPLEIYRKPSDKKQQTPSVEVFLRPPKGIADKIPEAERQAIGPEIYRYPPDAKANPQQHVPVMGGKSNTDKGLGFLFVYLGVNWEQSKTFVGDVIGAFGAQGNGTRFTTQAPGRENLTFDSWAVNLGDPPSTAFIYVSQGERQVALVYAVPSDKAKDPEFVKAIELSTQSLAVGVPAGTRKQKWAKRKVKGMFPQ